MIFDHQSRTGPGPLAAGSLDRDSGLVAALRRHEPRAADALVDTYGGRAVAQAAHMRSMPNRRATTDV